MRPYSGLDTDQNVADGAGGSGTNDDNTQTQTQSTQPRTQSQALGMESHLWGYLQPCSNELTRIDFWKHQPRYTIGRNRDMNDLFVPGIRISNKHLIITWDEVEDRSSVVTIQDLSSNGTFINGEKIGQGKSSILREGNELAMGNPHPHPNQMEDYRYIYRHLAAGPPREGLYAHYDIANELGKGSFATVVKAINRREGHWYAVKMIQRSRMRARHVPRDAHSAENNFQATSDPHGQFLREIRILESLIHPNICQLKEVFFDDSTINLVLELVDGGDLLDYIIRRGGLTEPVAKHITYQICDALAYVHDQDIAHRDLKPENVLLTKEDPPTVKVADFGLAKMIDSVTMLRTMCGTPSYLAPEVVSQVNQEGYDQLVDSWSVGVMVFSMMTNSSPFIENEMEQNMAIRIRTRTVDWSTLTHAAVSHAAEDFIKRLLAVDPSQRMTLSDARHHPWLRSRPIVRRDLPEQDYPSSSSVAQDISSGAEESDAPMGAEDVGGADRVRGADGQVAPAMSIDDGSNAIAASHDLNHAHARRRGARTPPGQDTGSVSDGLQGLQLTSVRGSDDGGLDSTADDTNAGAGLMPADSSEAVVASMPGAFINAPPTTTTTTTTTTTATTTTPAAATAATNGSRTRGGARSGSGRRALQRRSDIAAAAAAATDGAAGPPVPEPSTEMIERARAREAEPLQQPSHARAAAAAGRGRNKRLHSELTPIPDEHGAGALAAAASAAAAAAAALAASAAAGAGAGPSTNGGGAGPTARRAGANASNSPAGAGASAAAANLPPGPRFERPPRSNKVAADDQGQGIKLRRSARNRS